MLLRALDKRKTRTGDFWLGARALPWRGGSTPVLSGCVVCAHTEGNAQGCQKGCAEKQVAGSRKLSDKDVLALFSSMTINPLLIFEPLPWFPCLKTKDPFRECQSASG